LELVNVFTSLYIVILLDKKMKRKCQISIQGVTIILLIFKSPGMIFFILAVVMMIIIQIYSISMIAK
jgi:hypothetical protein